MIRLALTIMLFLMAAGPSLAASQKADYIIVVKSERKMYVYSGADVIRIYDVALGNNPVGHKKYEGDGRTPEGLYTLDYKNEDSKFHRSIRVSYPNTQDIAWARLRGDDPGGDIFIHGQKNGEGWKGVWRQRHDWTNGCIALRNYQIDELWRLIELPVEIEIRP